MNVHLKIQARDRCQVHDPNFKIVNSEKLGEHLAHGWKLAMTYTAEFELSSTDSKLQLQEPASIRVFILHWAGEGAPWQPAKEPKRLVVLPTLAPVNDDPSMRILADQATLLGFEIPKLTGVVPRSAWLVTGLFVGAEIVLPMSGAIDGQNGIGGDLLSPDGPLDLNFVVHPGIDTTIAFKNIGYAPAHFLGVLLGKRVKEQLEMF